MKSLVRKGQKSSVRARRIHSSSQSNGVWGHIENALQVFHDYYIPHHGNNHKPKIFHTHSVHAIAFSLLALKLVLVAMVFSITPVGAWLSPEVENEMVSLTNQYRASLDEKPLVRNAYLDQIAQVRAQDMIDRNYFSHYTPDGKKPWEWVDAKVYNYDRFGENLAADFITAKAVLDAFKLSPSHDKNLRNPNYRDIGIATVSGQLDGRQTNIMVVFYASPKSTPTPVVAVTPPTEVPTVTPQPVAVVPPKTSTPVVKPIERILPPVQPLAQATTTASTTAIGSVATRGSVIVTHVEGVETSVPADAPSTVATQSDSWLAKLFSWSSSFYFLAFIAFLLLAAVNIFVSFRIQHRSAIIASFFLIILAGTLWSLSWHGFELVNGVITILGVQL